MSSLHLQTKRLSIEYLEPADAAFTLALLNDPDFITHVGDRHIRTVAGAREYLEDGPIASYREHGFGMFRVRVRASGEVVGMCGLVNRSGLEEVDIGYAFLPRGRGRGLALEAAQAVFDYARQELGLQRIVAVVTPSNRPSIALLEKLGLLFERTIRLSPDGVELCLYGWTSGRR